ncbi:SHOCT domain-containing protein [Cryobacterium cryoconiti]|uniref:SHOCT domain-containing protein n=1 Tax=Cryobacterium cryoconiti TaxID=1259239 RepID=A0A4Y8JYQ5_9MICO|nr:SHOCT domain-containing protein [Cryobacterium cryoconiti]TFD32261.1 SHOCT domain-containing protein [Cryobacterium cryoconiti]
MMWGYNGGLGWTVLFGLITIVSVVTLIVLAVRLSAGSRDRREPGPPSGAPYAGTPGRSRARQILDERFAAGELTQEQYLEQVRALGEGPA